MQADTDTAPASLIHSAKLPQIFVTCISESAEKGTKGPGGGYLLGAEAGANDVKTECRAGYLAASAKGANCVPFVGLSPFPLYV